MLVPLVHRRNRLIGWPTASTIAQIASLSLNESAKKEIDWILVLRSVKRVNGCMNVRTMID